MGNEIVGLLGAIHMFTGTPTTVSDEPMTDSGDHKRYQITDVDKRYWAIDGYSLDVYVDSVLVTTGFIIEHVGGQVVFSSTQGASVITVDCSYFDIAEVGGFFNYKLSMEKTALDTTAFVADTDPDFGWETCDTGLKSWSVSAEKYYIDNNMIEKLTDDTKFVVILYITESTAIRYEGYVNITKIDLNNQIKELIKESIEMKGFSQLYFRD